MIKSLKQKKKLQNLQIEIIMKIYKQGNFLIAVIIIRIKIIVLYNKMTVIIIKVHKIVLTYKIVI